MIGVIVLPAPRGSMHGLDEHAPLSLLPLGDRPILQHIVEFLAHYGVTSIELILEHAPECVEALLGDGARWGCTLRYHLAHPEFPYKPALVIAGLREQSCIVLQGDALPLLAPDQFLECARASHPALFQKPEDASGQVWQGCGVFPAGTLSKAVNGRSAAQLEAYLQQGAGEGEVRLIPVAAWADASTPAALLATQLRLLSGRLGDVRMAGIETQPGVWISRNVVLHPSVTIVAPVYIGPNCRLNREVSIGPNAVLAGNCIVDGHSSLRNALLTHSTYVGQNLEIEDAIIDRNLLVNARLETGIAVTDTFLLDRLAIPPVHQWPLRMLESAVAIVLMLLCVPFYLLSAALWLTRSARLQHTSAIHLPAGSDPASWRSWKLPYVASTPQRIRTAGWMSFLWTFLPALPSVVLGRLSFVGLPPHTLAEIEAMPLDWKLLYLQGKAGLITEASVATAEQADASELSLAEAYYFAMRSLRYDLRLAGRYFIRLFALPVRSRLSPSSYRE